jgi:hypothetical protein
MDFLWTMHWTRPLSCSASLEDRAGVALWEQPHRRTATDAHVQFAGPALLQLHEKRKRI